VPSEAPALPTAQRTGDFEVGPKVTPPNIASAPSEPVRPKSALTTETAHTLAEARGPARRLEFLDRCDAALEGRRPLPARPEEVENLPPSLQTDLRALDAMDHLRAEVGSPWSKDPDTARLKHDLDDLRAALPDDELPERFRAALADKAARDGRPEVARVLRDLKAPPPAKPAEPPGLELPLPEGPGQGTAAPPREKLGADLPSLEEEAARTDRLIRQRSRTALREQRGAEALHLSAAFRSDRPSGSRDDARPDEAEDARYEAEVRRLLGRNLTDSERVLARRMRRQGKTAAEAANVLRTLAN
jgi:hypothetical protein